MHAGLWNMDSGITALRRPGMTGFVIEISESKSATGGRPFLGARDLGDIAAEFGAELLGGDLHIAPRSRRHADQPPADLPRIELQHRETLRRLSVNLIVDRD